MKLKNNILRWLITKATWRKMIIKPFPWKPIKYFHKIFGAVVSTVLLFCWLKVFLIICLSDSNSMNRNCCELYITIILHVALYRSFTKRAIFTNKVLPCKSTEILLNAVNYNILSTYILRILCINKTEHATDTKPFTVFMAGIKTKREGWQTHACLRNISDCL
jgi:hypothetical protein